MALDLHHWRVGFATDGERPNDAADLINFDGWFVACGDAVRAEADDDAVVLRWRSP